MISRAMKSHTNEHTVRGRPTLKVVKRFRKRVGPQGLLEINLRAHILSESTTMLYQRSYLIYYLNRGCRLFSLIKSIFTSVIVFLDVIVNQIGS